MRTLASLLLLITLVLTTSAAAAQGGQRPTMGASLTFGYMLGLRAPTLALTILDCQGALNDGANICALTTLDLPGALGAVDKAMALDGRRSTCTWDLKTMVLTCVYAREGSATLVTHLVDMPGIGTALVLRGLE